MNQFMRLTDYDYRVTDNADSRRASLENAAKKHGTTKVVDALRSRKNRSNGYKENRYRADINYLQGRENDLGSFGFDSIW